MVVDDEQFPVVSVVDRDEPVERARVVVANLDTLGLEETGIFRAQREDRAGEIDEQADADTGARAFDELGGDPTGREIKFVDEEFEVDAVLRAANQVEPRRQRRQPVVEQRDGMWRKAGFFDRDACAVGKFAPQLAGRPGEPGGEGKVGNGNQEGQPGQGSEDKAAHRRYSAPEA